MKIQILKSCSGMAFSFYEGEVVEVPAVLGKDLVTAGLAREVKSGRTKTGETGE